MIEMLSGQSRRCLVIDGIEAERFTTHLGDVYRAEVQAADEEHGFWLIWDLDGKQLGSVADYGAKGWKHSSLPVDIARGSFPSFEHALADRLAAILASGGVQTDDLYWEGTGFDVPRLRDSFRSTREGE